MAELLALISWLVAFFLFTLEWDEARDGKALSDLSRTYLDPSIRQIREESRDYWLSMSNLWKRLQPRQSKTDEGTVQDLDSEPKE
jgi:hypothetical protein